MNEQRAQKKLAVIKEQHERFNSNYVPNKPKDKKTSKWEYKEGKWSYLENNERRLYKCGK